jgi:hypothetical protein
MSIKKSLIALAAMAIALMGFASTAMAVVDGKIRDVTSTSTEIPNNQELHFVGAAKFSNTSTPPESHECHVTLVVKTTALGGSTGQVTNFTIPNTANCTGTGVYNGCTLTSHSTTNLPYAVTTTATDFDVTGTIVIHHVFSGCIVEKTTLTFSGITLKPLSTTNKAAATNTAGNLGDTATAGTSSADGHAISGVELSGTGQGHATVFGFESSENVTLSGKLELSEAANRCTWYLSSN